MFVPGAIFLTSSTGHPDFHTRNPDDGEEIFGYIKPDPAIIRIQLEIAVGHLRRSVEQLEGATDVPTIKQAAHLAHLSYRMLRFATHGTELLGTARSKRLVNPIYPIVADIIMKSRFLIIDANLGLAEAATRPDNNAATVQRALTNLSRALVLAQEAHLLI